MWEQLLVALSCAAAGILAALCCEPLFFLRMLFRRANIPLDVAAGLLAGVLFSAFGALFYFPAFRVYMFLFFLAGFALYVGSFHRVLAFFEKRLYNRIRSGCRAIKKRSEQRHERRKAQKK